MLQRSSVVSKIWLDNVAATFRSACASTIITLSSYFVDTTLGSLPGPVAQLGARMTGSHEVEGSNPSRSTNLFKNLQQAKAFPQVQTRTKCERLLKPPSAFPLKQPLCVDVHRGSDIGVTQQFLLDGLRCAQRVQ